MLQAKVIKLRGSIAHHEYTALVVTSKHSAGDILLQMPCWRYEAMEEAGEAPEKFYSGLAAKFNGEGGDAQ